MPPSVFISYSRREASFVDVLLDSLEDRDVQVWVDYFSLVPARPWWEQILEGIRQSEVFLLVVSRESLSSATVEREYRYALEQKKRIVLIIFEAVLLPPALQDREWVDFRGSFGSGRRKLLRQLEIPVKPKPAPQEGFKTSLSVWLAFLFAIAAVVISIPAWWTFYIPILLVPLPLRILRRDFHFYRVRFAVLTLPMMLLLTWIFFMSYPFLLPYSWFCLMASLIVCPLLLLLLSSTGVRLWGKPMASTPRFANPYQPKIKKPELVPFFIEHAPEDKKYADAIAKGLKKYGHPQVMTAGEALADFVLISRYKNSTLLNAEKRVVYPIMIQDVDVSDAMIRRFQWIDFRRGVRHLDSLGKLLPEPAHLLKALGVAPLSPQNLYPRIIQMLDAYLLLLGLFSITAWLPLMIELGPQFFQLPNAQMFLAVNAVLSALLLLIVYFMRRGLVSRSGWWASPGKLVNAIAWIGLLGFGQVLYILRNIMDATDLPAAVAAVQSDVRGSVVMFFPIAYVLGLILIGFFSLWNWGDLSRWFPVRVPKPK